MMAIIYIDMLYIYISIHALYRHAISYRFYTVMTVPLISLTFYIYMCMYTHVYSIILFISYDTSTWGVTFPPPRLCPQLTKSEKRCNTGGCVIVYFSTIYLFIIYIMYLFLINYFYYLFYFIFYLMNLHN